MLDLETGMRYPLRGRFPWLIRVKESLMKISSLLVACVVALFAVSGCVAPETASSTGTADQAAK